MTPAELYQWAKARNLEEAEIRVDTHILSVYPEIRDVRNDMFMVAIDVCDEIEW